jgi:hypothetical protein
MVLVGQLTMTRNNAGLQLPKGLYMVFDKGYNNYRQYARFDEQGIFFVTRQKANAVYISIQEFDLQTNLRIDLEG